MQENIALQNARNFSIALKKVPEVKKACDFALDNPKKLGEIIEVYIELTAKLDEYGEKEIYIIQKANKVMQEYGTQNTSASGLRANVFLQSPESKKSLKEYATNAFDPNDNYYEKSLSRLAKMMYNGHKMFVDGGTPRDGDAKSDSVIWGHTQAREDVNPKILLHFIVCHYLAGYLNNFFEIFKEKDDFLAVLTDVILLEAERGSKAVLKVWSTSRKNGGLGWINSKQINAYKKALSQNNVSCV
ncbi:MAG: hypothetical protein MAG795_00177 [Candidatus Woesearchaeota archaeon]|nr:hypothetical protein [Candidatus Woesearchaeota archaeon]